MGSIQPPIQCTPRVSEWGVHLEPSLKIGGYIPPLHISFHGAQGLLYFCLTFGGHKPTKQHACPHYNSHWHNNQQVTRHFLLKYEYIKINSKSKQNVPLLQRSVGQSQSHERALRAKCELHE